MHATGNLRNHHLLIIDPSCTIRKSNEFLDSSKIWRIGWWSLNGSSVFILQKYSPHSLPRVAKQRDPININKQSTHRNCTRYIFQCFLVKPSKNSFHCWWLTIGIWRFKRQVKVVPLYIKIFGWMICLKRLLGRSIDNSNWGSISQECFLSALAESSIHPSLWFGPWICDKWATQVIITAPDLS